VDTIRGSGGHFVKYEEDGWWEIGDNAARWVFEQWLCLYSVNIWYECVLRVLLLAKSLTRFSYPEKRLVLCSGTVFTHSTGRPERPKTKAQLRAATKKQQLMRQQDIRPDELLSSSFSSFDFENYYWC
jgi:hypothetical protein